MKFHEKLVILRKSKGLTQDDFASAVGVSRQAVYKWECGQSYPEVPKLIEMKPLLGISIDDLLDDNYDIPLPEKKRRKRISKDAQRKIEASVENASAANASNAQLVDAVVDVIDETPVAIPVARPTAPAPVAPVVEESVVTAAPAVEEPVAPAVVVEEPVAVVEEPAPVAAPAEPVVEEPAPVAEEPAPVAEEPAAPAVVEPVVIEPTAEPAKKVGFFGRIFGKK